MTTFHYHCGDKIFRVRMHDHHKAHEWKNGRPPSDAVTVHPRMLSILRTLVVKDSVLIKISPFYYLKDGVFKVVKNTTLNMTSYLPSQAHFGKLVLVGYNTDTETHEVVEGVESFFSAITPLPLPTNIPAAFIPSALVRLRYNITELTDVDITDARTLLGGISSGGGGTGDMLKSVYDANDDGIVDQIPVHHHLDTIKIVSPTSSQRDFTTIQEAIDSIGAGESITIALESNTTYTENLTIANRSVCIFSLGGSAKAEATNVSVIDGTITITGTTNNWQVSLINVRVTGLLSADSDIALGAPFSVLYLDKYQTKSTSTQRISVTGSIYTTMNDCDIQRTGGGTVMALDIDFAGAAQRFRTTSITGTVTIGANTVMEVDPATAGSGLFYTITAGGEVRATGGALDGGTWLIKPNGARIYFSTINLAHAAAEAGDVIEVHPGEYLGDNFDFNKADITIRGTDMERCILYNEDGTNLIQANATGLIFENLTFDSRNDETTAFKVASGASVTMRNCKFVTNSTATTVYGVWQASTLDSYYYDCIVNTSSSGATNLYGLGLTVNGGALIYRGRYDGFTQDLFASSGIISLFGLPVLVHDKASGTINGQWSSLTGELHSYDDIVMSDDQWIGLGGAKGRIEFDDQATDEINFLDANVGINNSAPGERLDVTGNIRASSQLKSSVATGTAPITVSSTTVVTNLNSDKLDGADRATSIQNNNTTIPDGSAVFGHTNASAAVHGLPANVHVLGHRGGAARFAQQGTDTGDIAGSSTSIFLSTATNTVTFPVAFASTPVVVANVQDRAATVVGLTSVSTTGFSWRTLSNSGGSVTVTLGYIAIGT